MRNLVKYKQYVLYPPELTATQKHKIYMDSRPDQRMKQRFQQQVKRGWDNVRLGCYRAAVKECVGGMTDEEIVTAYVNGNKQSQLLTKYYLLCKRQIVWNINLPGDIIFNKDEIIDALHAKNGVINMFMFSKKEKYVCVSYKGKKYLLHRLLTGAIGKDTIAHHINHNPRDNRKCNLTVMNVIEHTKYHAQCSKNSSRETQSFRV